MSLFPSVMFYFYFFTYQARAIIKAEPPFAIMHVNEPWTAMSGLTQSEADGLPLGTSLRLHSTQVRMLYMYVLLLILLLLLLLLVLLLLLFLLLY